MMGVTQAAGLSLKWFKDQFCQDLVKEAEETGADVYDQINKDVAAVAPGSNRLLYLPYLMGERILTLIRTAEAYFSDCLPSIQESICCGPSWKVLHILSVTAMRYLRKWESG